MISLGFQNKEQRDDALNNPESFAQYANEVFRLTEQIAFLVPGIEKRGFRNWDLDHKIPIAFGFRNGIHPYKIACLSNLRMISHKENFDKRDKILFPLSILDQHDTIQSQLQDG